MTTRLDELRKLAEEATPGEFTPVLDEEFYGEHRIKVYWIDSEAGNIMGGLCEEDSKFIAAANPAAIIELLSVVEALKEQLAVSQLECKRLREALEETCEIISEHCDERGLPEYKHPSLSTPTDTPTLDKYVKVQQAKILREAADDLWGHAADYLRRKADELEG